MLEVTIILKLLNLRLTLGEICTLMSVKKVILNSPEDNQKVGIGCD